MQNIFLFRTLIHIFVDTFFYGTGQFLCKNNCFLPHAVMSIFHFAGDLYDEDEILNWLLTQKDPTGEVIEELEGDELLKAIHKSESLAIYFCKYKTNY